MMLKHPEVCSQRLRNLAPSVATELCSVMPDIHKNLDGQFQTEFVFNIFLILFFFFKCFIKHCLNGIIFFLSCLL